MRTSRALRLDGGDEAGVRRPRRRARPSRSRTRPARSRSSRRRARARRAAASAGSPPARPRPRARRRRRRRDPHAARRSSSAHAAPPREHLDGVAAVGGRAAHVVDRARSRGGEVAELLHGAGPQRRATGSPSRSPARRRPRPRARAHRRPDRAEREPDAARAPQSSWRQTPATAIIIAFRGPTFTNAPGPSTRATRRRRSARRPRAPSASGRGRTRATGSSASLTAPARRRRRRRRRRAPAGVAGGRGGREVAADRRAVADLRRPDRARGLGERPEPGELARDPREGHAGADVDDAVLAPPRRELLDAREVEQRGRPRPAEVDLDHQVGAARDRHGLGVRGPRPSASVERRGEKTRRSATARRPRTPRSSPRRRRRAGRAPGTCSRNRRTRAPSRGTRRAFPRR